MGLITKVFDIFKPAADLVDALHTSEDEKLSHKAALATIHAQVIAQAVDFERAAIEAQSRIIVAEASADSWITRSWRPIVMLIFTGIIVLHWFGVGPEVLPDALWFTIQLGLGGYVGGRSLEKAIPAVVGALKAREET